MKSLLFIVPSRNYGGTNSSMSAIYNAIKDIYRIEVLTVRDSGEGSYTFLNHAFSNCILDAYYGDFKSNRKKNILLSFFLKVIKHFGIFFSANFDDVVCKIASYIIEKRDHYDVIIGFQEGLAMRVASNFANENKITWIHCDYERSVSEKYSELKYYKKFKKIVCVSQYTRKKFIEKYPSLGTKTYCIYNLLDIEKVLRLSTIQIDDPRFKNDCFTIISAGRMDPVKRFSFIPKIAKKLIEKGCKFRWYILGGPSNNEFEKIQEEIKIYNVSESVVLLGNKTNPFPYFKASDLYVSTSLSEACPMVFNEARICGIPIVSSNFGSSTEFITDRKDGLVGPVDELDKLIESLIEDKKYYNTLKANNRCISNYNDDIINKLISLF